MTRPELLSMGLLCGLSVKETMLSFPGEVFDLFELYLRDHGLKKKPQPED